MAFPDEGIPFIFTPFSANGSIPVLGNFHMDDHPVMNASGLAYVHHGGANTGELADQWGYGVRRGPATFHALQFAADAMSALQRFPVGDAGISLGTVGGMFADSSYALSIESRPGASFSVCSMFLTSAAQREFITNHVGKLSPADYPGGAYLVPSFTGPGGHPNSPTCGHPKFLHPERGAKAS